jgi:hypothetical protein
LKWLLRPFILLCYIVATLCLACLMVIGYVLTWCYRRIGWPRADEAINCFAYAIPKWLRVGTTESYLVVRMVPGVLVPRVYFAYSIEKLAVEHFMPFLPRPGWRGFIHAMKFKGRVRKGMGEHRK